MRKARLLMVTTSNNNKFYNMDELPDGIFKVEYGRVGQHPTTKIYSIGEWGNKYREKVNKGYVDQTHLKLEADTTELDLSKLPDIIKTLITKSRENVYTHYRDAVGQVTARQIMAAQDIINKISTNTSASIDFLNTCLIELYAVIPRRMKKVSEHLIKSAQDVTMYVNREQSLLDNLESQVQLVTTPENITLDSLGIEVKPIENGEHVDKIRNLLGQEAYRFIRAYKVINKNTQQAFDQCIQEFSNIVPLWHGSRTENWWSIVKQGLLIRPANAQATGAMFGLGIYFADEAKKSIGYTSLQNSYWARGSEATAVLGLYDVNLGRSKIVDRHYSDYYHLNYEKIRKDGYQSVFAKKGVSLYNNEYIIYQPKQTTITTLVEIK